MNSGKITTFKTHAFGCRVNQAEEEEIRIKMGEIGFKWSERTPDIFIINTCAVTDKAEREARQMVYRVKKEFPKTFLVVTGCALTNWQKESLLGKLPIDFAVDNVHKEYLVVLLKKRMQTVQPSPLHPQNLPSPINHLSSKYLSSGRYLIKIQDGCHRFCTFCIVPYLRGLPVSTPIDRIVKKIRNLSDETKEVVLAAINTEAYGRDTGESFLDLVKEVLAKTDIKRLSFGSIHPWSIDQKFLAFYAGEIAARNGNSGRFADFFHIPMQSGSDKILALMKRGYKRAELAEKLETLQRMNRHALIGTDVIAGFLEETDRDFEDTYEFLKKTPINKFHVFRFSRKKKTAAHYLAQRLHEPRLEDKKKRSTALIRLGQKKYRMFQQRLIGQTFECLFLRNRTKDFREGLLSNQVPVLVRSGKTESGSFGNVKITSFRNGRLMGKKV